MRANSCERGLSMVEFLVATTLMLVLASAAYALLGSARQAFQKQTHTTFTQAAARQAIEEITSTASMAGYSPLGVLFEAVPVGDANQVRLKADHDGNGVLGQQAAVDEDVTYRFVSTGEGSFQLLRGVDQNGDGDFEDRGERLEEIASDLVRVDLDGDGELEPFLRYDAPPPDTVRVVIALGVLGGRPGDGNAKPAAAFHAEVALRNRLQGRVAAACPVSGAAP